MLNIGVFLLNQVLVFVIIIPINHAHRRLFNERAEDGRLTYTLHVVTSISSRSYYEFIQT